MLFVAAIIDVTNMYNYYVAFFTIRCVFSLFIKVRMLAIIWMFSQAKSRSIPILIDAEKKREGLDELLELAEYVVCSSNFPQVTK